MLRTVELDQLCKPLVVAQGWDIHEFWAINTCIYVYLYGYAYIWTKYI